MGIHLIGWVAAILSAVSLVPQALKSYKTRSAKDVSFLTFFIITASTFFWFIYGLLLVDWPLIVTNLIQLVFGFWILSLTFKHGQKTLLHRHVRRIMQKHRHR
jgi:MtN3 and saliva related transmembrane protein